jgi:TRAP-type C4-dicarboxylate transport system substrate-binding protein
MAFAVNADTKISLAVTESCPYICAENAVNQGVLIDIVKSIFDKKEIQVEIQYYPMKRAMRMLDNSAIDGVIGILQRNAPQLIYPEKSIGQVQYLMYTSAKSDWFYTGLNSLKGQILGVEVGKSYGIVDSYIQRHAKDNRIIYQHYGESSPANLIQLLKNNYIDILLEDKNIFDFHTKNEKDVTLEEGGVIPADHLYIGFSPSNKRAQEFADLITSGITGIRETGELTKILATYGLSDWESWSPTHRDPFSGNYIQRLENNFFYEKSAANIDTVTMVFEGSTAKDGGYWKYATKFKESLERLSGGKLKVQLKFGVTTEHDIVMNISEGKSHMGMVATNNLTPFAPSLGFLALPYMFPKEAGIKKLFHSPLMDKIADRAGLESNVRPLSFFIGGYRLLANSQKTVKKTTDLRGLRIRVPRNQLMIEAFRSWGIEPVPLPWTEIWPALESGIIQGQENPINIIFDGVNKTQEVWDILKYITNIRYFMFTAPHMISESFYRQLSEQSQSLVREAAKEAEVYSWELVKNEDIKMTQFAKSKGMIFVDPLNEKQDWQAKARSIWPDFYFRVGGKELVDQVLDVIDEK